LVIGLGGTVIRAITCSKCGRSEYINDRGPIESYVCIDCLEPVYGTISGGRFIPHEPEEESVSKEGRKYDSNKPDLSYISSELMEHVARVREYGAKKYTVYAACKPGEKAHTEECFASEPISTGRDNWRKGFKFNRSIAAALRHLMAFKDGEDYDIESNQSHIAHTICCLEHLLNDFLYHPHNDDRTKKRS
jgi:hypothetical protein